MKPQNLHRPAVSTMAITYTLRFDGNYGVESIKKDRARGKFRWLRRLLKGLCALGMLALAALGVAIKTYAIVAFAASVLVLLALGPSIDFVFVRMRYRMHAQYGLGVTVELEEESVKLTSPESSTVLRWPSFKNAVQFPDGLMLYLAPWHYVWLPDSAIRTGGSAQARVLTMSKIANYKVA